MNEAKMMNDSIDPLFERLFAVSELAQFTRIQWAGYEESLKHYRDLRNCIETARQDGIRAGIAEGIAEGITEGIAEARRQKKVMVEIATRMVKAGMEDALILSATELTPEQLEQIKAIG